MINSAKVIDEYYEWLLDIIGLSKDNKYNKLLQKLHSTDYYVLDLSHSTKNDINRAKDGEELRYIFVDEMRGITFFHEREEILDILNQSDCSILEMMIALSRRFEEDIMIDPDFGNRTGYWFWEMIRNLGLYEMNDYAYEEDYVEDVIVRFLDRKYGRDGKGGPFYIPGIKKDLRKVELWYQLCWYTNLCDVE